MATIVGTQTENSVPGRTGQPIRMDLRSTPRTGGSPRSFRILEAACLCLCLGILGVTPSGAEPPPSIQASHKPGSMQIADPSRPAVFPEQAWHIIAPHPLKPTIAIWTIEPFRNANAPQSQVDAQLNLTLHNLGQSGDWQVLIPQDRTAFSTGRTTAHVVAGSVGGNAEAGITVSFLCHEQPFLADGVFEAVVVGTITEAF